MAVTVKPTVACYQQTELTTLPTVSSFCLEKPNPPLSIPRVPAGSCAKLTFPGFCTPPAEV